MRGDELEAGALRTELVDRCGVKLARQEQLRQGDREEAPKLFDVGPFVPDRRREEGCETADSVERCAFRGGEDRRDRRGSFGGALLELAKLRAVRGLVASPVVEVNDAEEPVTGK